MGALLVSRVLRFVMLDRSTFGRRGVLRGEYIMYERGGMDCGDAFERIAVWDMIMTYPKPPRPIRYNACIP